MRLAVARCNALRQREAHPSQRAAAAGQTQRSTQPAPLLPPRSPPSTAGALFQHCFLPPETLLAAVHAPYLPRAPPRAPVAPVPPWWSSGAPRVRAWSPTLHVLLFAHAEARGRGLCHLQSSVFSCQGGGGGGGGAAAPRLGGMPPLLCVAAIVEVSGWFYAAGQRAK